MDVLEAINLAVRFVVELFALFALGWWGLYRGRTQFQKYALAAIAPLTGAAVWGLFVAPNAEYDLGTALRLVLQVAILGAAFLALVAMGKRRIALVFGIVAIVNGALLAAFDS